MHTSTQEFSALSPDTVLDAIAASSQLPLTGGLVELNSYENRVYQIEVDNIDAPELPAFVVTKFYRPNRWTEDQIKEEHQFLFDLAKNDLPVIPPRPFSDRQYLHRLETGIYYCMYDRLSGRTLAELSLENAGVIGSLIARVHTTGVVAQAAHRKVLSPSSYGRDNLQYLLDHEHVCIAFKAQYEELVNRICDHIEPWFDMAPQQRLHGDCHLGNIIQRDEGFYLVDFDDMVMGPPVQDLWIIASGLGDHTTEVWQALIRGYETFNDFDYGSLRLIEPLRALRFIHFHAWLAKRYHEPAFQRGFPHFAHANYWQEQISDLGEVWQKIQSS